MHLALLSECENCGACPGQVAEQGRGHQVFLAELPNCRAVMKRRSPPAHYGCRRLSGSAMNVDSIAARLLSDAPMRWIHCFCYFCLVLSLPWSIWITSGWFGLLLHFQVASGGAWLLEPVLYRRPLFRKNQ